jgi:hypothetical protein
LQLTPQNKKNQVLLGRVNDATAHHQNEKSPALKQTKKHSHTNHCFVESSTTLLKPQIMVWWKLWGYKFIDHLCEMLQCDKDGLFIFSLKV